MLKFLVFFCLLLSVKYSLGQATFHKVYSVNDSLGSFSSVEVLDSGYNVGGSIGRFNRVEAALLTLDLDGNIVQKRSFRDAFRAENLSFAYNTFKTVGNNEKWVHYTTRNNENGYWLPKIARFKNDTILRFEVDTLKKMFTAYFDAPKFEIIQSQNRYFIIGNYEYFNNLDSSSNLPSDVGAILMAFDLNSDNLLYYKKYNYSYTQIDKPRRIMKNFLRYSDTSFLILLTEDQEYPSTYSKLLFYKIDISGNIQQTYSFQDTPYSKLAYAASFLNNQKDLLICYSNSVFITPNVGQPYWGLTPAVARLDSNFQIIWKKDLGGLKFNPGQLGPKHMINKFAFVGDSAFIGAYFRVEQVQLPDTLVTEGHVRLVNGNTNNGNLNWIRDYNFYPLGEGIFKPQYEIRDIEKTQDGGFIFVGEARNPDSLVINAPGQLGYILKTNCLGFLDDPQAGFSATTTTDSLAVNFQNTSLMGGSFQWSFGDGTSLTTGETAAFDSTQVALAHVYADTGTYEVQLIAYGCNGVNDTLTQTVVVSKSAPVEVANPNIANYMAIGPNPVKSGESIAVYVGNLPSTSVILSFYDYQGKLVMERTIGQENSTYIIVLPFSSGVYQAVLKNGKEVLEVEKILIY